MTGVGTVDLGTKQMGFRVEPKLVMTTEGQGRAAEPVGFGIPVIIDGPWAQPRIYPEMSGILENPDQAYSKLKEMGKGLFGPNGAGLGTLGGLLAADNKAGLAALPAKAAAASSAAAIWARPSATCCSRASAGSAPRRADRPDRARPMHSRATAAASRRGRKSRPSRPRPSRRRPKAIRHRRSRTASQ